MTGALSQGPFSAHPVSLRSVALCALLALIPHAAQGQVDAEDEARASSDQASEEIPIESFTLEDLLGSAAAHGGEGSFGFDLQDSPYLPYLHAYTTFEWSKETDRPNSFDIHYFNLLIGANLSNLVIPEIQLEHEHGDEIAVRYAQVDVRLLGEIFLRSGLFLTPFGAYNEYFYPEYLSKLPRNPLVSAYRHIVPTAWNDVGVQLFGTVGGERKVQFAAYVTNGLLQADDPATPEVEDGGAIRDMRGNYRDRLSGGKAVGGRISYLPSEALTFGASLYSGEYTADDRQHLTFLGAHLGYEGEALTVRSEGAYVLQETRAGLRQQLGMYTRVAYRISTLVEPALGLDVSNTDLDTAPTELGILGAVNLYPYAEKIPTLIFRVAGAHYLPRAQDPARDVLLAQLTLGF